MIKDAGFTVQSDHSLDDLILNEVESSGNVHLDGITKTIIKDLNDLRPQYTP
jgi:hypothetical protein